jgi:hypothetical protein
MNPVVVSKYPVPMPDGIYPGTAGGHRVIILSQDKYHGLEIPLEFGIRTTDLAVTVVVRNGKAYCYDKGFRFDCP